MFILSIVLYLFAFRIIAALLFTRYQGVDTGYELTNQLFGSTIDSYLPWWAKKLYAIKDDYLYGKRRVYKWVITIAGAIVTVVMIVKGIIAVLMSEVFWLSLVVILSIAGIVYLLYNYAISAKAKKASEFIEECESLETRMKDEISFPMLPDSINKTNIEYCKTMLADIKKMMEDLCVEKDERRKTDIKRIIADKKLELFCKVPFAVKYESLFADNPEAMKAYNDILSSCIANNDFNPIRKGATEDTKQFEDFLGVLSEMEELLKDNQMESVIDSFERTMAIDTTDKYLGLFTSTDKLADKTKRLTRIYDAAVKEYEEMKGFKDLVENMLILSRLSAYQSLYLGSEVLDILKENSGGNILDMIPDSIERGISVEGVEGVESFDISSVALTTDAKGFALEAISSFADAFENDSEFAQYVESNPKEVIGTQALDTIGDIIKQRSEAIANNNEIQSQIAENLPVMVESYEDCQSALLKAIETIRAIINANLAFNEIYEPICKNVFEDGDPNKVSLDDIKQLTHTMMEYDKIAKSELVESGSVDSQSV